jgi:agmatinase
MKKITLQGILFDEKSSFLTGPAKAPPLIRKAYNSDSANYFAESGFEIKPGIFDDKGDFEIFQYFDIEKVTYSNLNKNIPILTLGGDHSISFPVLRAIHKVYGPLDILHIDAHGDLYDEYEGDKHSHACPFSRIMEEDLAKNLVQVGIRTMNSHQMEQAEKFNVQVIHMSDFDLAKIPRFQNPLYISLDMDALDPAFAPGVSHHEPGGLSTREVIAIIQAIETPILGADIVEYNPKRDINDMTAMVCAKLLREIASKMLENS